MARRSASPTPRSQQHGQGDTDVAVANTRSGGASPHEGRGIPCFLLAPQVTGRHTAASNGGRPGKSNLETGTLGWSGAFPIVGRYRSVSRVKRKTIEVAAIATESEMSEGAKAYQSRLGHRTTGTLSGQRRTTRAPSISLREIPAQIG
jgi:hypothetical protein